MRSGELKSGYADTFHGRVPHSHELNKISIMTDDTMRAMMDPELVRAHRERALSPDHPVVRGTAHNPDTFFQARESANPFYAKVPEITRAAMDQFKELTGRAYAPFVYEGDPKAEHVVISMGSGAEVVRETARHLVADGEKVGALQVILYRPFSAEDFLGALPETVKTIAVLDRAKEPGAVGEPLYQDVVATIGGSDWRGHTLHHAADYWRSLWSVLERVTPGMVKAIYDMLASTNLKNGFTIGITDDVSGPASNGGRL